MCEISHVLVLCGYLLLSVRPQMCGVSILRAGETMEPALQSVCKNAAVGKILIQTSEDSGEPEVGT